MNKNQVINIVTTILQFIAASFVTKGVITHDEADTLIASFTSLGVFAVSHNWHGTPSNTGTGTLKAAALAAWLLPASLMFTGCATPEKAAYESVATTRVSVETALHAYDVFAAAGKTTVAQNAAVKAAYIKYQAAFAFMCDAGAAYAASAATNSTGATGAQLALTQAESNAATSLADLENLIQSFGVKL